MKGVQDNIAALDAAQVAVRAHCMCAKLVEQRGRFVVHFPPGYAVDAAQMRFSAEGVSKTRALELLHATCEKYWQIG